jgi:hypothetical protein
MVLLIYIRRGKVLIVADRGVPRAHVSSATGQRFASVRTQSTVQEDVHGGSRGGSSWGLGGSNASAAACANELCKCGTFARQVGGVLRGALVPFPKLVG